MSKIYKNEAPYQEAIFEDEGIAQVIA